MSKPSKKSSEVTRLAFRRMRDRERKFEAATAAERRVLIAKDVIAALRVQMIDAQNNGYLNMNVELPDLDLWIDPDAYGEVAKVQELRIQEVDRLKEVELRDFFIEKQPKCTACALGAVFVCTVMRADELKIGDLPNQYIDSDEIREYLSRYFSDAQIDEIEYAFEQGNVSSGSDSARIFGLFYDDPAERMTAIMKNIVANDGRFVPSKDVRAHKMQAAVRVKDLGQAYEY